MCSEIKSRTASISVIVPVRNCALTLRQTFDSILTQTLLPEKVIVVYDQSTDNTLEIIQEYKTRYSALFELLYGHGQGIGAARQVAIDTVKTEYIAFLDGDDWYTKDALEQLLQHVEKTGATCGNSCKVLPNGRKIVSSTFSKDILITHAMLRKANYIPFSATLYRTSLMRRAGGVDAKLPMIEDYDLHLRLTRLTDYYFINKIVLNYRMQDSKGVLKKAYLYAKWEAIVWRKNRFINWHALFRVFSYTIFNILLIPLNIFRKLFNPKRCLFREEFLRIFVGFIIGLLKGYPSSDNFE